LRKAASLLLHDKIVLFQYIAKDGQEALDFLHRKSPYQLTDKPDLVILDINLPKLNGKEVLGLMKGDKDLAAIPVIMYTSSHHENDKVECYKKKADLYLTKFNSFQEFQKTKDSFKSFLESKFN